MCNQTRKLIKAHIIPRKFFEGIRGTGKYSVMVDANKPLKQARTFHQAGGYDSAILCEDCEKKFSDLDHHGWQILGKPSLTNPLYDDLEESLYGYKIDCDTDKIRRFILAVVWRATVSRNPFYSEVDLGPYESILRARLFDPAPLRAHEFPTVAMRLDTEALGIYGGSLFQPFKKNTRSSVSHVLYLTVGLKFVIITGRGSFPSFFQPYLINAPNSFLLVRCPKKKEFMPERDYVPAMIAKTRRAEAKDSTNRR
jgi:hypothetical protein